MQLYKMRKDAYGRPVVKPQKVKKKKPRKIPLL
jgi:hypothetical protein